MSNFNNKLKRKYHPGPNKEPITSNPKKIKGVEELNELVKIKEEKIEDLLFINYGLKCENEQLKKTIEKDRKTIQTLENIIEALQNDKKVFKK